MEGTASEDPVFGQVVQVGRLLTKAKKGLPETSNFCNMIYMHTKFHDKCEFYVPHEDTLDTIIMWQMIKESKLAKPKEQYIGLLSYEEPDAVVKLLNETHLLDWSLPLFFMHLSKSLASPITQMLKKRGKGHTHFCKGSHYIMDKSGQKHVPLRCPKGYKVKHLGKQGIITMLKKSQFFSIYNVTEYTEFAAHVPCIGLFLDMNQIEEYEVNIKKLPQADDSEVPIAHAAVCYFGTLSFLGCEENYWLDGLMGLMVQVCGRMMVKAGLLPHVYIQDTNVEVKGVMDVLPGWKNGDGAMGWAWNCDGSFCP